MKISMAPYLLCWLFLAGCNQPAPQPTPVALSTEQPLSGALQADVQLPKDTYFPGEQIDPTVIATGLSDTAWVGVVPSDVPHGHESVNDEHDLNFKPVSAVPLFLVAPSDLGSYDVRLNSDDDGGAELASRTFKVVPRNEAIVHEVKLEKQTVAPGETVKVSFTAPDLPRDAWIGIVPSAIPHGSEDTNDRNNLGYQHLEGRSQGWLELGAPKAPGSFDVRLHDMDREGKELTSATFKVVAEAAK